MFYINFINNFFYNLIDVDIFLLLDYIPRPLKHILPVRVKNHVEGLNPIYMYFDAYKIILFII
jgi:hypothetical protein